MKLIKKIYTLPLLVMAVLMTGCERDYDAPPLNEPVYNGAQPNLTLAQLKEKYSAATDETPIVITEDYVVKAYITGNDESGNIYKQIFVQDATGALPIQIDQGNVYTTYRRGQEVYINLKDMCVSVYGGEQQLGWPDGYLYRMPFTDFKEHVQKNGWPYPDNVKPEIITNFNSVNLDVSRMSYRLVQLEGVSFVNGGKNTYATKDKYGEEPLKDAYGNTITVRTSGYASFAFETLPVGTGTVVGILGRFNGAWQLTIPAISDVFGFDGVEPGEGGGGETGETTIFNETFGTPVKTGTYFPFVKDYTGFDNPASMFGGDTDKLSVRVVGSSTDGNVWYPKGADYTLTINGINAKGATKATLVYYAGANVFNAGEKQDLNTLKVKCNGIELTAPSKEVSGDNKEGNNPFEMRIENVTVSDNTVLDFSSVNATNTYGLRLFGVKLIVAGGSSGGGGGSIYPTPGE